MSYFIIGGDLVPTNSNIEYFINGSVTEIIDEKIVNILINSDYNIFNLEGVLTSNNNKIKKCGPNISINPRSTIGFKKLNIHFFTLANNHILDFGKIGLQDTLKYLASNNFNFAGAGKNVDEARIPHFFQFEKKRICIYSCTEHEFSIATSIKAGANPYDPLESFDEVRVLRTQCDYLIVLYHGGKEFYRYPSPSLKRVCEKFIDTGANLVVCQHSHCIGCFQKYNKGTIVYGQGNFLFDRKDDEFWSTGLLVKVSLNKNEFIVDYLPILKKANGICLPSNDVSERLLEDFYNRSEKINNPNFLMEMYSEFCKDNESYYLRKFLGRISDNIIFRILIRLFNKSFINLFFSEYNRLELLNILSCEAHREMIINILEQSYEDSNCM